MNHARIHADAGSLSARPMLSEILFISFALEQEKKIEILEKAFNNLATEQAVMPQRTPITTPDHGGLALFMPAYLKGMSAIGAKIVTVYRNNPTKYDMPTVLGTIILLDEKTGAPIAVMDGGYLTAMRTGGVAGLATKFLGRNNAKVHTMFGTGGMARARPRTRPGATTRCRLRTRYRKTGTLLDRSYRETRSVPGKFKGYHQR